jgi:transposase
MVVIMVLSSPPVPIPEKKITYKTASNGTTYVYYTLRAYRNKYGNPTSDEVAIGKKDPSTGMLIPNRRYFELFESSVEIFDNKALCGKRTPVFPDRVASYGNTYSLLEIAESTGLRSLLEECFPEKWQQILVTSFYMLCEGNVMMYLDDWFDETDIPFQLLETDEERMDDQQCSRLFASLSYGERLPFLEKWAKLRSESEYIAYDVTSVSSYSTGIDNVAWGYNRDNERLPQINLGMFYGLESSLPVYYEMYNGSIVDKSHLPCMMASAERLGIKNTRFVFDCGMVTEPNLKYMDNHEHFFVTSFPGHLVDAKAIIDSCKDGIRKSANRIDEFKVYAFPTDIEIYGFQMKAHVYFDTKKQSCDERELYSRIERLRADLEKIGRGKRATKKYTDLFMIEEKEAELSFMLDNDKIDEKLSRTGFFILISNDLNMSSRDVLKIYRGREIIEENFDQLKNDLDFRRLRTHINKTTDGKVFVGFIALIMRSYLLNMIKNSQKTKKFTIKKIFNELRKIKTITFEGSQRMVMPLTKLQKGILETIGVLPEKLQESLK